MEQVVCIACSPGTREMIQKIKGERRTRDLGPLLGHEMIRNTSLQTSRGSSWAFFGREAASGGL